MALEFPRSISDGYPEYVDDERGYHYHAWEVISASESRRHERIRIAEAAALTDLQTELAPLSDLDRWALGQRWLHAGDVTRYFELVAPILSGSKAHRALHYPEIFADMARRKAEHLGLDQAQPILDKIAEYWPELESTLPFLEAQVMLRSGAFEQADKAFKNALAAPYTQDPTGDEQSPGVDLFIEIAEAFVEAEAAPWAEKWIDRARQRAEDDGDTASLVDIDLLARRIDSPSPE